MRQSPDFPLLADSAVSPTSPRTREYNCIAWAAGVTNEWWWPGSPDDYWPIQAPQNESLGAFIVAFVSQGFVSCADGYLQEGFEKVAIYVKDDEVQHMARQLPSGYWTSKIGKNIDIEHVDLEALEGPLYGSVAHFMRRAISE